MLLSDLVSKVPLVGPGYARKLDRLNIRTVKDLVFHFPYRYQDFGLFSDIALAQPGEVVTIQGQIISIKNIYTRSRKIIQQAIVSDGQDQIDVIWFNQTYLVKNLPPGIWISLSGKVGAFGRKKSLVSPQYEKLQSTDYGLQTTVHTGRLVPVYPETAGLSSKWLRAKIARLLPEVSDQIEEYLPEKVLEKNSLLHLSAATLKIHFPESLEEASKARRRLAFDEFFKLQLAALWRKNNWKARKQAIPFDINQEKVLEFTKSLPFILTEGQKQAVREIFADIAKPQGMNRLLEGDVGSGKTVVAALTAYISWLNGYKTLFMAPTQILATQHFNTLKNTLEPLGLQVGLVTGDKKSKLKTHPRSDAVCSKPDIIVGTHALLHRPFPENVALVIIDEQHRFGVAQRALLSEQHNTHYSPHTLTMTATPIPRTVALTMYGDLDLSQINELPKGRLKIKTWVVPPQKRDGAYDWIRKGVKDTDEQAFIICPLIDISEAETLKTVRAASAEFARLQKEVFPDLRLSLMHGRIRGKEKDETMNKFREGKTDILVATPVVEVGIDIPNATIMLVEAAERFGLAGLHQLRGRVGRSNKQSYCLLFTDSKSQKVLSRLRALERDLSGAQLAELDLKLRGPGEVYGTAQSGFPELKVGNYADLPLIKLARDAAEEILRDLDKYPKIRELVTTQDKIAPN